MSLQYYEKLDRLTRECKIKEVGLYGYSDAKDVYERVAVVIEKKLHWLDLKNFTLDDLRPQLEVLGLSVNDLKQKWGIYDGLIAIPQHSFHIEYFDRSETDVDVLVQNGYAYASNFGSADSPWWDACALAEYYELHTYENCDDYEYVGDEEVNDQV